MKRLLLCLALLMLTSSLASCFGSEKKQISTDGSTSMQKAVGSLGEYYTNENPNINFTFNPTGSGAGITAVLEDRCHIGLSSRNLKDEEIAKGLKGHIFAYDGIAVIVNKDNPLENITLEDLKKIYTGEIKNWKTLGGNDEEIVLIGREAGSGTRDGFEASIDAKHKCYYRQELTSSGDVITTVSNNPSAIGYASLASVRDSVKIIKVDGVYPGEETIKNKTYLISRPFIMVTKEGKTLPKEVLDFYNFVKSEEAHEIIRFAKVVPAGN